MIAVGGKNGNGVMLSVRIIEIEELIIILKPSVNMRIFRFRNVIADGQENVLLHPFFILYGTIGPVADEHIGNAVCGNQRIQSFFPIAEGVAIMHGRSGQIRRAAFGISRSSSAIYSFPI